MKTSGGMTGRLGKYLFFIAEDDGVFFVEVGLETTSFLFCFGSDVYVGHFFMHDPHDPSTLSRNWNP